MLTSVCYISRCTKVDAPFSLKPSHSNSPLATWFSPAGIIFIIQSYTMQYTLQLQINTLKYSRSVSFYITTNCSVLGLNRLNKRLDKSRSYNRRIEKMLMKTLHCNFLQGLSLLVILNYLFNRPRFNANSWAALETGHKLVLFYLTQNLSVLLSKRLQKVVQMNPTVKIHDPAKRFFGMAAMPFLPRDLF